MKRWQIVIVASLIIVGLFLVDGGQVYVKQLLERATQTTLTRTIQTQQTARTTTSLQENWWKDVLIIGDRRLSRSDFWLKTVPDLRVQVIDHVGLWNTGGPSDPWKSMVENSHGKGAKALALLSMEVERGPFGKYYASLPEAQKWRFANGSVISDPFSGGAAKNLLGNPVGHWHIYQGEPMPQMNMVTMSIHNPNFLKWQLDSAKIHLNAGADGLSVWSSEEEPLLVTGDFSHWTIESFREYLRRGFDERTLASLGVKNIETFDISLYIINKYGDSGKNLKRGDPGGSQIWISTKASVFDDPMMREYVRFQRISLMNFFDQITSKVREFSSEAKRNFALKVRLVTFGASWLFTSTFLSTLLISRYHDIVGLPVYTKDYTTASVVPEWSAQYRLEPAYKAAMAAGGYEKPVWAYTQWGLDMPKNVSHKALNMRTLTIAEAYAQGAIREIMFADWLSDYATTDPPPRLQSYLEFVWRNQRYLRGTASAAKVALVYSVPSFLWRSLPLFDMYGRSQRASIHGFARALEDSHTPYDIVIFGHPELFDDQRMLERLSQYDLLVLPNVDCMSAKQVEALREFVRRGGAIIASGEMATYNEDYVKRDGNVLSEITRLAGARIAYLQDQPEVAYWNNVIVKGIDDASNLRRILSTISSLWKAPQLETDRRRLVSVNVLQQTNPFPRMVLHLVNYNYEFSSDSVKVQEKIPIRIQLPTGFRAGEVMLLSPDDSSGNTTLPFNTLQNGIIEFEVPKLFLWDMVVIRTQEEVQLGTSSKMIMESAKSAIEAAKNEHKTASLIEAETLYQRSQDAYLRGNYEEAIRIAAHAKESAEKQTKVDNETLIMSLTGRWPFILATGSTLTTEITRIAIRKRRYLGLDFARENRK